MLCSPCLSLFLCLRVTSPHDAFLVCPLIFALVSWVSLVFTYLGSDVSVPAGPLSPPAPLAGLWDTFWASWPPYTDPPQTGGPHARHSPAAASGSPQHAHSRSLWTDPPDARLEENQRNTVNCITSFTVNSYEITMSPEGGFNIKPFKSLDYYLSNCYFFPKRRWPHLKINNSKIICRLCKQSFGTTFYLRNSSYE